ncbi:MAG: DUF2577 family protein [Candidatus Merdivicinus sp.]|jgi:hypothetical protein
MISEVMKEIARGCIDEKVSAAVAFGTVITTEPITIRVEERLVLDEGMLVVPEELKKRETEVQLGSEVKTITLSPGLKTGDKAVVLHLGDCWLLAGTVR